MKSPEALSPQLTRRRPRAFLEWRTLRRWGKLPDREAEVTGYLLRTVREGAGLTQAQLAEQMGISQQAVARAERWGSNPTIAFMRRWAHACGQSLKLCFAG
ncbi:helix-turn-helix transcriptional regulator [bacterium]|nr:helix-turn-helix transcriptional regulator [bacterium]